MPPPGDLTPESGGPTDVAPLGRNQPKPIHELTAEEDAAGVNWDAIAATPEFKDLLRAKARFIIPCTVFFILYFLALLILVGFFPEVMKTEVLGRVNLAYLFGLSQFFMAWILAAIYVKVAAGWDRRAQSILSKLPPR